MSHLLCIPLFVVAYVGGVVSMYAIKECDFHYKRQLVATVRDLGCHCK
jgi:hypothetical protein